MGDSKDKLEGDDFAKGIALERIKEGVLLAGHAHGEALLLTRVSDSLHCIGAKCSHYGAPLADGLVVGDTVRCPWHHAAFSLRTGEALRAPALGGVSCWQVEQRDGKAFVTGKSVAGPVSLKQSGDVPSSIVIIGGGAAGQAAAETLRQEGYKSAVIMISSEADLPCDRPNLSKDYLAGKAEAAWLPLRPADFYEAQKIEVRLSTTVQNIDVKKRELQLSDGSTLGYGALLLATGAEPIHLDIPGSRLPHVHYLRTQADGMALAAAAESAKNAVVIGASFIGLEVASSLRARGIQVQVVGREAVLMEKVLGPQVGAHVKARHEHHGVVFHLEAEAANISENKVTLKNGDALTADLVVIGIGVRPVLQLAEQAGMAIDHGVIVDEYLQTSVPGIYAAGDIARWPDALTGERLRVEHWVVAGRQGQTAARNLLGQRERFDAVPFFWTKQHDFGLRYVGHASHWDQAQIDGSLDDADCTITYCQDGKTLAVAMVKRDMESLRAEVALERALGDASHRSADVA